MPDAQGRAFRPDATHVAAIVESAMDAIISVDDDQRVVLFNPAAERMFGVPASEALGAPLDRFLPERFRQGHSHHVRRFADTSVTRRAMGALHPLTALRADGSEFPIEASISRVATAEGRTLSVILRDVSERVRHEELLAEYTRDLEQSRADLRALSAKLHDTRETERAHIAREVHDRLGQSLTALSLGLDRLYQDLDRPGPTALALARKECQALSSVVQDAIRVTRRLASELHPAVLDHLGLAAAVEWQAQDFGGRAGLVCHVDVDTTLQVPKEVELPLFRVLQESLTNVVRHAEARTAIVTLHLADGGLELVVEDDGRGVVAPARRGLGLLGMRERLADFGGTVTLSDRPAVKGARLVARVPWPVARREVR
ncbi:PAS domain-containing sensor histidine kinase [Luteitalea sp. TBR-22]|uniref:PAS domain-containing sensor histidine kinase n=1 Tax=Luteitalea sp. TBR-22 TaxID=2802971 RepID=UPI001EF57C52|nr:PAS domain-containing sensor histidine kinase [Luteitalea sp. TBR-22]